MIANQSKKAAAIFLAPSLTAIAGFFFIPVIIAFLLSFSDFDIYSLGDLSNARLVGFKNYRELFVDPLFWTAMKNTLLFVALGTPLTLTVALGAALLLNSKLVRFKGVFRVIYFAPRVTTLVAVAVLWRFIYHPRFGLLNFMLGWVGVHPIDWLGDPFWAMPAIILMSVWKNFGYAMIIFIVGLQNIPDELYEAARIDGAGGWQQLRNVTLPMLAPVSLFVSIITMIDYFQFFAEPYVMTQGGPLNSTLSIVMLLYQQGFRWWNMGYSASVAFVLFALIFAASLLQAYIQRKRLA